MNILQVAICLISGASLILIIGALIYKRETRKTDFLDSVIFMRELIKSSELSETAYRNLLDAFREFDLMSYKEQKAYKKLVADFLFKYRDFLPCDKDEPRIKIIPDGTDGYYNYKIQIQ